MFEINNEENKIVFEYEFVNDRHIISNKDKRDASKILAVDALFTIKCNDVIYFQEEIAILEFYKSLYYWKRDYAQKGKVEFHYYTVEYDDYEDGALISLQPFSNYARIHSIFSQSEFPYIFNLKYILKEFTILEEKLSNDIEDYFRINLRAFIKHIPFTLK